MINIIWRLRSRPPATPTSPAWLFHYPG